MPRRCGLVASLVGSKSNWYVVCSPSLDGRALLLATNARHPMLVGGPDGVERPVNISGTRAEVLLYLEQNMKIMMVDGGAQKTCNVLRGLPWFVCARKAKGQRLVLYFS